MKHSVLMQQTSILDFSLLVVWIHRNWKEVQRVQIQLLSPPPRTASPTAGASPRKCISHSGRTTRTHHRHSWWWYSAGLDKCIMTRGVESCPEHPLCPTYFPLKPLAPTDLFNVFILLSFPECHTVGIMHCVGLSDCLLSLSNVHLKFLHVFSW